MPRYAGVIGQPGQALDRDPLADPPGGGQLRPGLQRPLRHQREQHPLHRSASRRRPAATRRSAAPIPSRSPHWSRHPRPAQPARVQHLDLAARRGDDRLLRGQEPRDRGTSRASASRSTVSARPKLWITFAVEHPGHRVAFVVRQLQVRHHRPVPVRPPGLPQVHAHQSIAREHALSSDTPQLVCLHETAPRPHPQVVDLRRCPHTHPYVPIICGSRV